MEILKTYYLDQPGFMDSTVAPFDISDPTKPARVEANTYYRGGVFTNGNYYLECVFIFKEQPTLTYTGNGFLQLTVVQDDTGEYWVGKFAYSGWQGLWRGMPESNYVPIFLYPLESTQYFTYITTPAEPTYNWQSVPSISGKNGILQSLVQIKEEALNDGEPVSGATVLSFDSLGNINIPSVIDEQMPVDPSNPTSVTITYLIPVLEYGSYSYIKAAIKKNSIPLSLEDADRVVDLDEPQTITRIGSATVSGLDELSHYYFVIFIEDEQGNTASSEPQDCVTGERTTIDFFTDSFNSDLMKDGWNLNVCQSGFGDGSTQWAPTSFSSDFLSTYNFLVGNYNRDIIVEDNGILKSAGYNYGTSDSIYWIPIKRVNGELKGLAWDYCNLRSVGGSYDAIGIFIGWVDSNNGWHQSTIAWVERLWSSEWQHGEYTDLSIGNPYIDYIGIYTCDGQPACKNIILTVL